MVYLYVPEMLIPIPDSFPNLQRGDSVGAEVKFIITEPKLDGYNSLVQSWKVDGYTATISTQIPKDDYTE
jgi:hypothetical protein